MNRGQNQGSRVLKRAWLALCACVCIASLGGVAPATTGAQPATVQPQRAWENYFGVAILPSGRVVVVGDKGVIMTTGDQGQTWTRQQRQRGGKYYDLYSVAFTSDGARGWVVGDNGTIFRSDDGGMTWSEQKAPPGAEAALLKVAVADAQRACASGEHGVLLCTSDGGANWNLQKFQDFGFFDIAFSDANNVWAVGEFGTLLHTGDGGKSWQVRSGGDRMGKSDPYFGIVFGGGGNGLAVGLTGNALETNDGGKTWKAGALAIANRSYYTVAAVPERSGEFYAAGENGVAALITGGKASQVESGTSNAISAVAFSPRFAMSVGLLGTLLRSEDGGQHWQRLNTGGQALQTGAR